MKNSISDFIDNHLKVFSSLKDDEELIESIGVMLASSLDNGGKILFCGNGGSSSDSQHLAGELMGRFVSNRIPLPAIALSSDSAVVSCISNDFGYDYVFSRQVEALGLPGDVLVGISTSGNSTNVLNAIQQARSMEIGTVALLGKDGGKMNGLADLSLTVKSDVTARIQECHIFIGHVLCSLIEEKLGLA